MRNSIIKPGNKLPFHPILIDLNEFLALLAICPNNSLVKCIGPVDCCMVPFRLFWRLPKYDTL